MAHDVAPLSAERHYMGSAASGHYSTDRSVRPTYDCLPSYADLRRRAAARCAQQARYLRSQDVVGHVLDHCEARAFLAWGEARLAELEGELAETGAEGINGADRREELERAAAALRVRMGEALAMKREASRQLRLIGISPQAQAGILRRIEGLLESTSAR